MELTKEDRDELKALCMFLGTRVVLGGSPVVLVLRPCEQEEYSIEVECQLLNLFGRFVVRAPRLRSKENIDLLILLVSEGIDVTCKEVVEQYLKKHLYVHPLSEG